MDGNFHEEKWAKQLQRIRLNTTDVDTPDGNQFSSFLVLGGGAYFIMAVHTTQKEVYS